MKINLLLLATIISIKVCGQNDTILYFSKFYDPVQTLTEAIHYEKLTKTSDNKYVLSYFKKSDGNWKQVSVTKIKRQTDTSFIMTSTDEIIRLYHKVDSGYLIKDIKKNNSNYFINKSGFSKKLFPLIKSGIWKDYNPLTGDLLFEYLYKDNLVISNKYWINDTSFVNNISWIVDEYPHFQGGESEVMNLIYSNIDYPFEAQRHNIQGTVSVGFVLLKNGQIIGMRVLNIVDKSLAKEAMRVVNLTSKKWIPGKIEDNNVNTFMAIPITFKLQ